MSDERKPWEQMIDKGEPVKWYARFDRFRLIKPWLRSVNAAFLQEQAENPRKPEKTRENADKVWYQKAQEWEWDKRAAAWDKYRIAERDKQTAAEEEEVLNSELALKHNRIKELQELAALLKEEVYDEDKRWVEDIKVGKEPYYVKQFNDAVIREYRATLDDIAKEKGERAKLTKSELTGKDGAPLEGGTIIILPDNGRDPAVKEDQSE